MARTQPGNTQQTAKAPKPKKAKITHTEIGRIYLSRFRQNTIYARGYWYRYAGGVWSPVPDFEIEKEIWDIMEGYENSHTFEPTDSAKRSIMSYIRATISVSEEKLDAYPNLINLKNGIYNLDTDTLIPHDPALLLTSQLPFEHDPAAKCPFWDLYINTTFTDITGKIADQELIYFIQEIVGYSLTTDISHQVMFWCIGEGENGKGVLFHVLMQLGGPSATYIDLNILRKEKYQLATLLGKRIAMCSEASSHDNLVEDGVIKSLVAGDPTPVRQIRREPFILYPQAKLWWSMNRLPTITDTSHGFWRRMRPIPFNNIFEDGNRIINLKEKLNQELSGIFNWCLIGLRRLRSNKRFSMCLQVELMKQQLQLETNTIRLFLDDEAEVTWMNAAEKGIDPDDLEESSKSCYLRYVNWTKANGYKAMSDRSFKIEMEALKFYHKRDKTGTKRIYTRLKLKQISSFAP